MRIRQLRIPAGLAAGLALAAALTGCSGTGDRASSSSFVAGDGTVNVVAAKDRSQPVVLAGTTLEGSRLDLASLRGRPVVLNVWGSWCPPCRQEEPALQTAYQQLKAGDRVEFVGINIRNNLDEAKAYQRAFKVGYPSLRDEGGELLLALRGAVAPSAIPSTLVLDSQGRIAARVSGPVDTRTVVGLVKDVLKEGAA